jgi:predicted Zn-dependent protease
MQRQLGESEKAQESIAKAFEVRDTASEVEALWISRIHSLFQRDMDTAKATWEELVEKYPDHPWVLRLRAEFAKQNNEFDTALEIYDELLDRDPDAVAVHNLKGYLYLTQGEYEQAILSLQRYAYYAPDQANPHDSLGEAFLHVGRYEESIQEFKAALEIDPAFLWSARNLSEALSITGQQRAAIKVLEHIKPVFKQRDMVPWWDLTRTMVALRAEDWDEVLQLSEQSLERLAGMGEHEKLEYDLFAHYARTLALLETSNLDAALEAAGELERVAQQVGEYGNIADLARPQQQLAVAKASVKSRFARAENSPANGIPDLESTIESVTLSPHELAWPMHELATAYLEAGQPETAAATAQRILDAIPTSPDLNLLAAKAHARAGDRDTALSHLQVYLDVMRNADEGHSRVAEATSLLQQLTPRS